MIRLITKADEKLTAEDVFAVKIVSEYNAYFKYEPYGCYIQQNKNKQTALISFINGNMCISACEDADVSELREFVSVMSPQELFCDSRLARRMKITYDAVNIMRLSEYSFTVDERVSFSPSVITVFDSMKLGSDGDIVIPPFDAFAVDFSHKQRHGCACAAVIPNIACAMALAITEKAAYIGGVAVKKELRGSGLGRIIVSSLCAHIAKDTIYVTCRDSKIEFYKKLGFFECGKAAIFRR